jgi:hypothetical protein
MKDGIVRIVNELSDMTIGESHLLFSGIKEENNKWDLSAALRLCGEN